MKFRIGRTARGGEKGTAYTLVTDKDKEMVGHLVRNLEGANQYVPEDLMNLAMQSSWFRKSRFQGGKGKSVGGGAGLGFRERPGLGRPQATSSGYMQNFAPSSDPKPTMQQPTNRLEALKSAFKSQYASQFKTSTDKTWETPTVPSLGVNFVKPSTPESSSSQDDQQKKKRSRWN